MRWYLSSRKGIEMVWVRGGAIEFLQEFCRSLSNCGVVELTNVIIWVGCCSDERELRNNEDWLPSCK